VIRQGVPVVGRITLHLLATPRLITARCILVLGGLTSAVTPIPEFPSTVATLVRVLYDSPVCHYYGFAVSSNDQCNSNPPLLRNNKN